MLRRLRCPMGRVGVSSCVLQPSSLFSVKKTWKSPFFSQKMSLSMISKTTSSDLDLDTTLEASSMVEKTVLKNKSVLTDSFGRFHGYLRMSLTEKCNLRCVYCMPAEGLPSLTPRSELLNLVERKQLLRLFASLGSTKLRFTGGEPTVSRDLTELIEYSRSEEGGAYHSIGLTSNGILLNSQLEKLFHAGLTSVNVSLDTLMETRFQEITRREGKLLNRVLSSIFKALAIRDRHYETVSDDSSMSRSLSGPLMVKVNCVVSRGMNDDEIGAFVRFAMEHDVAVRFIELMPFDGNAWDTKRFVSYREIVDRLRVEHGLELVREANERDVHDTTKWYEIRGSSRGRIGFITSMSNHFCGGCNRLRITADGKLKVCLFGEESLSLRDGLRSIVAARNDGLVTPLLSTPEDGSSKSGCSSGDTPVMEGLLSPLPDVPTAALSPEEQLQVADLIQGAVLRKAKSLGGHATPTQIAVTPNRPMILIGG